MKELTDKFSQKGKSDKEELEVDLGSDELSLEEELPDETRIHSSGLGPNDETDEFGLGEGETAELEIPSDDVTGEFNLDEISEPTETEDLNLDLEEGEETNAFEMQQAPDEMIEEEVEDDFDHPPEEDFEGADEIVYEDEIVEEEGQAPETFLDKLMAQLPFLEKFIKPKAASEEPIEETSERTETQTFVGQIPDDIEEVKKPASGIESFIREKVPALIPILEKIKGNGGGGSDEPPGGGGGNQEEPPKKKIKVIHILIIGLLAVFVLLPDPEESKVSEDPAPKTQIKPKYKRKGQPKAEPKVEEPKETEAPVVVAENPEQTPEPVEQAPVEEPSFDSKPEPKDIAEEASQEIDKVINEDTVADEAEKVEQTPVAEAEPSIDEAPEVTTEKRDDVVAETEPEFKEMDSEEVNEAPSESEVTRDDNTEEPKEEVADSSTEEEPSTEMPVEEEPAPQVTYDDSETEDDSVTTKEPEEVEKPVVNRDELNLDDKVIDEVAQTSGGEQITEAILEQLEKNAKERRDQTIKVDIAKPTDPPSYLDTGSGLVYNCAGRHWACVSASSFKQCGDNYAWRLKENAKTECYPSESYGSDMDCASMQQYKIDMNTETEFCL